jgi:hypothetical protein
MEISSSSSLSLSFFLWWLVCFGGWFIFLVALWQAHIYQGKPLSQLGVRPKGRGLLEWWWHSTTFPPTGVWGYDPILGSFAPLLRIAFHGSAILILSSFIVHIINCSISGGRWNSLFGIPYYDNASLVGRIILLSLGTTAWVYLSACYYVHHRLPGVSVPGGPRPHKIQRQPQWETNDMAFPNQSLLACQAGINDDTPLCTGEPAGRDVWMCPPSSSNKTTNKGRIPEAMVQEMAAGGRTYGIFNPSINPNRYVRTNIHIHAYVFSELLL